MGLDDKVWGETGVIIMQSTDGEIIGPPADNEYAVDPIGVEIIKPSQLYVLRICWSINTCIFNNLEILDLLINNSLNAYNVVV